MLIDIITLFTGSFAGWLSQSMVKRAQAKGEVRINTIQLRDFAIDERGTVDERPFGGGPGMLIRPEPIFNALKSIKGEKKARKILLTARGVRFKQKRAEELCREEHLILVCGHYEGVDERVRKLFDEEISIGDYVLTGGEVAAMAVVETVVRLVPGVLGKDESSKEESFSLFSVGGEKKARLLEYPQYTQPREFRGEKVPEILLSGNHERIKEWRLKKALKARGG